MEERREGDEAAPELNWQITNSTMRPSIQAISFVIFPLSLFELCDAEALSISPTL
jgi:hypothetical protein